MELQFKKSVCSCLDGVLREVRNSELTQEIHLPDSMPDIGRILSAWGQAILRSKEWRGDSIGVSAGMMVWVLYQPEDGGKPRRMESWIPFQMTWDLPDHTPEGDVRILCLPRFVDARSVSARKMMVRAGLAAMAEAWVPMSADVYTPDSLPENVELLRSTYPVRLPKEAGEKSFLVEEELTLPGSAPQPEKIVYYRMRPVVTDRKVLANKIVFRGNGNLHVLYESEEGQLHSWDFDVPFSQYQDLKGSHSGDARVDLIPMPTAMELELEDEGHLRLKGGMVAQYLVDDMEMVEVVEDAYSPVRELGVRQEMLELPAILDSRRENIYGEQTISADANLAVDGSFLPEFPHQRTVEDGVEVEMPGTFQFLYYDAEGNLQSAGQRWEGRRRIPSSPDSTVTVQPIPSGEPQINIGNGSVSVKAEFPLQMTAMSGRGIPMVTGLEMGDAREPDPARPSLILRRAGNDRLWDLAKESGSTVEAIRKANHLQEEPAPNQMLLIPVS